MHAPTNVPPLRAPNFSTGMYRCTLVEMMQMPSSSALFMPSRGTWLTQTSAAWFTTMTKTSTHSSMTMRGAPAMSQWKVRIDSVSQFSIWEAFRMPE